MITSELKRWAIEQAIRALQITVVNPTIKEITVMADQLVGYVVENQVDNILEDVRENNY